MHVRACHSRADVIRRTRLYTSNEKNCTAELGAMRATFVPARSNDDHESLPIDRERMWWQGSNAAHTVAFPHAQQAFVLVHRNQRCTHTQQAAC